MNLDNYQIFYLDHDKLREEVKSILKKNGLTAEKIAPSIGYAERSVRNYMLGVNNSRFMAGALLERFNLNPRNFMRDN